MRVQTKGNHGTPFISIRNKLLVIFMIPTIMLLSINAYINAEINTMIDDISGIYASNTMLNELQISLTQVHHYLETFLDTRDTEAIEGYLRNQQEFSKQIGAAQRAAAGRRQHDYTKKISAVSPKNISGQRTGRLRPSAGGT